VAPDVIVAAAGPEHCQWQSATFLTIGWPLGTPARDAGSARQYIRDPLGVVPAHLLAPFEKKIDVPRDARPTGYRYQNIQLYLAPSDQDSAAYLVGPGSVERWPRSDPMTVCS
jgi:hypothetical protein